jgi:hypothetical protein
MVLQEKLLSFGGVKDANTKEERSGFADVLEFDDGWRGVGG